MRHRFTKEEMIRGARKAIRNPKTPKALKKGAENLLRKLAK